PVAGIRRPGRTPSPICCRVCDGRGGKTQPRGTKRGGDEVGLVGAVGGSFITGVVSGWGFLLGGTARMGGAAAEPPPYLPAVRPPVSRVTAQGPGRDLELVAHLPLLDDYQWNNTPMGIPRGDNGDITIADHCVYVGAIMGYQPAVVVDVKDPARARVVGPVPDLVPGVMNGGEGIEASADLLVIDQRAAIDGLGYPSPPGLPTRGLAVYDISNCEQPRLVARFDYEGEPTHLFSLWRVPENPARVLAIQTFGGGGRREPEVDIRVVDLSGCPKTCTPHLAAKWGLPAQFSLGPSRPMSHPGT